MQYGDASSFYISEYHRTVRAKFIFWNLLFQSLWYILVKLNISMTWRLKIYFEDILPNGVKEADGGLYYGSIVLSRHQQKGADMCPHYGELSGKRKD